MTGRKPIPAELINASDHKKSSDEIDARQQAEKRLKTKSTLVCPKHLSIEAKKEWHRLMRLYKEMHADILCALDIQPLLMYCEACAIYKKAQETWTKYTVVISANEEAQRILDKSLSVMSRQSNIIRGLSEQLCLTPVGRARMGMNAAKKENQPNALESLFDEDD